MNRLPYFAAAAAVIAGLLVALFVLTPEKPAAVRTATVLPQTIPLPSFSLIDHTGTPQTENDLKGQWHLLFFGFTHCPDICPTTLATLTTATRELRKTGTETPRIVLVSVDPERDTPEVLAEYIAYFDATTLALVGPDADLRELTEPLFVYYNKVPLEDGDYTVDHSSFVMLINPAGEFHAVFSGPHTSEDFMHDLPLIMGDS